MTILQRRDQAIEIQKLLGIPSALSLDFPPKGLWHNAKNAWLQFREDATHHMVLQDDIEFHPNLAPALINQIIPIHPNSVITLFQGCITYYKDISTRWVNLNGVKTAQALILPTNLILHWLKYDASVHTQNPKDTHDDERLDMFCKKFNITVWLPMPELVQHTGIHSSIGSKVKNISKYYQKDLDPTTIDWTDPSYTQINVIKSGRFEKKINL